MKKFGSTINEIKNDNFIITKSIDTYSDKVQKAHQFSQSIKILYEELKKYKIDLVYLLGDCLEAYVTALVAHFLKIPIAHYGGGTLTNGALDNFYRYNISNLSNLHFATTKNNYNRLLDNTLIKSNVNFTGSTAIDGIVAYKKAKQNYPNSKKLL